jgi:uncharacterized DUF497 family protein
MDVTYRLQDLTFEWSEQKASSNLEKHGVTFEEAAEAFFDPFSQGGEASVQGDRREFVLGYSLVQHLLLVVYEGRRSTLRIISARPATRTERKLYEQAG